MKLSWRRWCSNCCYCWYTYPDLEDHVWKAASFQEKVILAPINDIVDIVNDHVLSQLLGKKTIYLSFESISNDETNFGIHKLYSTEFVNTITCSRLLNNSIRLKVVHLRSIDKTCGIWNSTRLVVNHLDNRIIEAVVIFESNVGHKVFFFRGWRSPCLIQQGLYNQIPKKAIPFGCGFEMTINKSQG